MEKIDQQLKQSAVVDVDHIADGSKVNDESNLFATNGNGNGHNDDSADLAAKLQAQTLENGGEEAEKPQEPPPETPPQAALPQDLPQAEAPQETQQEAESPQVAVSMETFHQLFKAFAKFGDSKSTGDTITLTNSDKWFKQAKIIGQSNRQITTTDTGIYFKQISKTKKALTFKEYNQFLEKLAQVKKIDPNELIRKLQQSGPPATNKTTTAVTSGAIGRLTDHTRYTGSHRQRFDEQTGKGRGKAGRVDPKSSSGYVSGFRQSTT